MALETKNNRVSKVILNGETLIDLTDTTATVDTVLDGYKFLDATGAVVTGTCNPFVYEIHPDYIDPNTPGNFKADAITMHYIEYIDYMNTEDYIGINEAAYRAQKFTTFTYEINPEGIRVPVIYKLWDGDGEYETEQPDLDEPYYYRGKAIINGNMYDRWRKIEKDRGTFTWEVEYKQYAYTNPIVINNSPSIID